MYVAWRDLRFARGRFALMGTVVGLLTVLVVLLSGLTAGLGRDSTSAIADLPVDRIAFAAPAAGQERSFADSAVAGRQWRGWAQVRGVDRADPVGIATARGRAGDRLATLATFGVPTASRLAPGPTAPAPGRVVLSSGAARDLGARAGDVVSLGAARLTVAAVTGDAAYRHTPVVWTALRDWRAIGGHGGATVVALRTDGTADVAAADGRLGTSTVTTDDALPAIAGYASENASLQIVRALLLVISALVTGAFFAVWTIQRSGDVAVLKALGASTGVLLRDALGQAVVLLALGTAAGTAVAVAAGAVAARAVPFALDVGTAATPALLLVLLGAGGAALAVRRIVDVDPLTALGAVR